MEQGIAPLLMDGVPPERVNITNVRTVISFIAHSLLLYKDSYNTGDCHHGAGDFPLNKTYDLLGGFQQLLNFFPEKFRGLVSEQGGQVKDSTFLVESSI